jgi:hypothetical protein
MFKKINIFSNGNFICSTTQSKTCKEAIENFIKTPIKGYINSKGIADTTIDTSCNNITANFSNLTKEFKEYFYSFYGVKGIYPIEGLKDIDIIEAIEIRKKNFPDLEFDGDSIDREIVRDIILDKINK